MKTISISLFAVLFFISSSCCKKTSGVKENTSTSAQQTTSTVTTTDSSGEPLYRFIISFYSVGEGTEGEQMTKLEKFIPDYGKKINKDIPFEKTHWGREGEANYCFKLDNLSPADQLKFMDEAKSM